MKARESGMPDESMWSGFFSPDQTLAKLGLTGSCRDAVDLGCGYGTFTIPAARLVRGTVHALDIEADMVAATARKALDAGLSNVRSERRDFLAGGTGLPDAGVDYVMLFNLLHCDQPERLLGETYRVLSPGGRLGIMHWNYDPTTPRGPSIDIRPRPEQCRAWAEQAGFQLVIPQQIDLPPYHYGWVLEKR
ncbi:MAG: class I SAM-dependent methyltransferase [Planctomycetaceae bacterium]|nr:MAG: class I SAM-dependent methyltransferase [Planctomycetaceae bacterium]